MPTQRSLSSTLAAGTLASLLITSLFLLVTTPAFAGKPAFRALCFYTTTVEPDHVHFSNDAIRFYTDLATKKNFVFDTTTDWSKLNDNDLKDYQLVIWLNDFPQDAAQRGAFERFVQSGGSWLGFHVSGYNDKDTNWPWFVNFLGGAVFYTNNWPPLPAALIVDDNKHAVTKGLPTKYDARANEWYMWKPSARLNPDVHVLVTLNPSNYPLGKKDLLTEGDIPVVWTNTKYHMLYMNMGHGDKIFDSPIQNRMFENAIQWLGKNGRKPLP